MTLKVKISKLIPEAVVPSYAHKGDAGMDLVATSMTIINENDFGYIEYGTGLQIEIPEMHEGQIRPRSSISKTGLILANSPGTIDSGYRGEIKVRFKYIPNTARYEVGDRIAQLVIKPYPFIEFEVSEVLNTTERGDNGFGSTGK